MVLFLVAGKLKRGTVVTRSVWGRWPMVVSCRFVGAGLVVLWYDVRGGFLDGSDCDFGKI